MYRIFEHSARFREHYNWYLNWHLLLMILEVKDNGLILNESCHCLDIFYAVFYEFAWLHLGLIWSHRESMLAPSCLILASSWPILAPSLASSWAILAHLRGKPAPKSATNYTLNALGAIFVICGVIFEICEYSEALLGTLLGGLGGSLGTFLGIWAAPWGTFSDLGDSLGDLVAPNGSQN